MTTKTAYIEAKLRDPETQEIMALQTANGTTEDEGATVVINNGYLPNLLTIAPEDITIQIQAYPEIKTPTALVSRTDDAEANTSTLVFTLPA